MKKELEERIEKAERTFKRTKFYHFWSMRMGSKTNIYSGQQLSHLLYKVKGIEPINTTETGAGSTDEDSLTLLGIDDLNPLIHAKKMKKLYTTYLEAYEREAVGGRLHPEFNLNMVKTYRSSSSNPNFQNLPKRDEEAVNIVRGAVLPSEGHRFVEIDFSGIEVRISSCYHHDPKMIEYIRDPTTDMHRDVAQQIFKLNVFDKSIPSHKLLRQVSKNGFVFPQFYGSTYANCAKNMAFTWCSLDGGPWKRGMGIQLQLGKDTGEIYLSDHLRSHGIRGYSEFVDHVKTVERDFWYNRFRVYQAWKEENWTRYQRRGYVDMFTGFRCSGVMRRTEVNNIQIQGSAFHCLLWSFIEVDRYCRKHKLRSAPVLQIHDSIIMDMYEPEREELIPVIRDIMVNQLPKAWDWIVVPLDVEVEMGTVDGAWNSHDSG
jgi:DNA polymerase-1